MNNTTVAIIGTAGRNEDGEKLDGEKFEQMVRAAGTAQVSNATLVSGGAAWADHVAVVLFLLRGCNHLILHFPAPWDYEKVQFSDTGVNDWRTNPGGTANHYHEKFSNKVYGNPTQTFKQIAAAIKLGAEVIVGYSFHGRNTKIAEADNLIAMTFGTGPVVKDGGTRDTYEKFVKNGRGSAIHIDLNDMLPYKAE